MSEAKENSFLWLEYYEKFPYFSAGAVRRGCHPRKLLHSTASGKALVLVHGLTDSPYFLMAIAEYFHHSLGYDVYMPLLQGHGLRDPQGMSGVTLAEWKKNVRFAIRAAAEKADRLSMGGLSTGGALSFFLGASDREVSGDLYLFSPALGLYWGRFEFLGRVKEFELRFPFVRFFYRTKPLVGNNPYRYSRVPLSSVGELVKLIREIDGLVGEFGKDKIFNKKIFCGWSEYDKVISLRAIRGLKRILAENDFTSFEIPEEAQVDHACVVLKEPVYAIDTKPGDLPLEEANPLFYSMMAAIGNFESAG